MNMPQARRRVAVFINWFMLFIAFVAITIGYVRLDRNQDAIAALAKKRAHDNCLVARASQKSLRDVIVFTTKPADLTGLTPERLAVVVELNAQRAKARGELLGLLPDSRC